MCHHLPQPNCCICLQPMLFPAAHLGLFAGCSPGLSANRGPVDLSTGNFKARISCFASCILARNARQLLTISGSHAHKVRDVSAGCDPHQGSIRGELRYFGSVCVHCFRSPCGYPFEHGCTSSAATVPQVVACAGTQPGLRAKDQQSVVLSGEGDQTAFTFDHVAGPDTSQQQFYRGV